MGDSAFDPNKFAAELVIQATEQVTKKITESSAADKIRRLIHSITDAYAPFLEKTYRRVSTIRTFLRPTESLDLLQVYVPVGLTDRSDDFDVDEVLEMIHDGQSFVVSALAGRGKSVLMRYLALALYHSPKGRLPLFIELRSLNALTTKGLLQLIHTQYRGESNVSFDDFKSVLSKGYFVIILDGFDEVAPPDRAVVEQQIVSISEDYPDCPVIVSGRNDDRFYSWERFKVLHLRPMDLTQTRALISNAKYDEDVKKTFLRRLNKDFFDKHESFLNTPLLAIMLMLTFEEYAEIPHSIHEFYRNAFDTLVRRHDAMKNQFLRATHSGCTAEEFKRLFSSFCVLTYSKSAYAFHREKAIEYLQTSIGQQGLSIDSEKVLDDLIESVCLLQEEGFEISFVHRSFQEYFCALFVSSAPSGFVGKYLESGNFRVHDDVLPMLYGINPDRVEEEWANAIVEEILNRFPISNENRDLDFIMECMPSWGIDVGSSAVFLMIKDNTKLDRYVSVLRRFYPDHFELNKRHDPDYVVHWQRGLIREAKKLEALGVPGLEGFTKAAASRSRNREEFRTFWISIDHRCRAFLQAVYDGDLSLQLKAIEKIRRDQRSRKRQGDKFLDEIFKDLN